MLDARIGRHDSRIMKWVRAWWKPLHLWIENLMNMLVWGHHWASPMWSIQIDSRLILAILKYQWCPLERARAVRAIDAITLTHRKCLIRAIRWWVQLPPAAPWTFMKAKTSWMVWWLKPPDEADDVVYGCNNSNQQSHWLRVETVRLLLREHELIRGNMIATDSSAKNVCPNCACMSSSRQWTKTVSIMG